MIDVPDVIVRELRREARRKVRASMAMTVAASLAFVVAARHRSPAWHDWAVAAALALAGLACAAGSAWRRTALAVSFGAPSLALAAALAAGGEGALDAGVGVECVATELAAGALVVGATWLALRGGTSVLGVRAASAGAATGALAGAAALQLTCPAHGVLGHLLAFHVAGVALASGVVAAVSVLAARRAP